MKIKQPKILCGLSKVFLNADDAKKRKFSQKSYCWLSNKYKIYLFFDLRKFAFFCVICVLLHSLFFFKKLWNKWILILDISPNTIIGGNIYTGVSTIATT